MLKLAVIGAQTLLGRELVNTLEARDASVVPLSIGALTVEEEIGDLVVFAPSKLLLEGLDAVILADTLLGSRNPDDLSTLQGFSPLSGKVGSRNGAVTVTRGQVDLGTGIPVTRLCVEHLDRSPRSAAACDVAFPPVT